MDAIRRIMVAVDFSQISKHLVRFALALARKFGYQTDIIAARWIDHAETHVRIWNYGTTLLETIQVRYYLLSGAYDAAPYQVPS